ncbi:type II secretion system secretin GspD [Brevundimonas sp.]|uniref:type II secretion system secretin GspD n=1 Tax=Brevundimonas sp. TaxID=1871086 RepID=UPI001A1EF733|nr:type II secretion system secretin GspD [Brevundimonas sp.]MBJ7484438.1 type II secretion system secretin GspD [Brevundimonas sp.]
MRRVVFGGVFLSALTVSACQATRTITPDYATIPQSRAPHDLAPPAPTDPTPDATDAATSWRIEGAPAPGPAIVPVSPTRSFGLVFDQAPVATVADGVLGQALGKPFRVDSAVQGALTFSLTGRMTEAEALFSFNRALKSVGAALSPEGRGYAVVPEAQAHRLTAPPVLTDGSQPLGAGAVIYQAREVGAAEIARLLEPLAGEGTVIRSEPSRQQVVITGDPVTVNALVRTARSLDVDWFQGKSLQFFPVRYASPADIAREISLVLGGAEGPLGGQIQIVELDRLNGLLVIARSAAGLDRAAEWIQRFDRVPPPALRRLRSIALSNLEAEQFVQTLAVLLDTGGGSSSSSPAGSGAAQGRAPLAGATPPAPASPGAQTPAASDSGPQPSQSGQGGRSSLRITADARTNSIILLADDAEYRNVLDIVRELDAPPPQVLIEATIAEVTLNDRIRYGVQWFFDDGDLTGGFGSGSDDAAASSFPGFSLRYFNADVRAVLNALSAVTDVQLISTPRLLVLSNESATLNVGDQVPVITQSAVGLNEDSRVVNSVDYRDTGVVLSVTPRVSESGRMFIQIEQEVSEVAGTTSSDIDSPTIQQRKVSTRVQVEDGQLIVLGGLLRSARSVGDTGIPYLDRIPVLGAAFRTRDDNRRQTELVMFLRPTVVRARSDVDAVSDDMVRRLRRLGMPVEAPRE